MTHKLIPLILPPILHLNDIRVGIQFEVLQEHTLLNTPFT